MPGVVDRRVVSGEPAAGTEIPGAVCVLWGVGKGRGVYLNEIPGAVCVLWGVGKGRGVYLNSLPN